MGAVSSWAGRVRLMLVVNRRQIGNRVHGEGNCSREEREKGLMVYLMDEDEKG